MTGPGLIARWLGPAAERLNHHEIAVAASPERTYQSALDASLQDMPVVRLLLTLRGIAFQRHMTVRDFFSTAPFGVLEERAPREIVFGIVRRRVRAVGNFRVEASGAGAVLSTETWVETYGRRARLFFRAYWLVVGPSSGLIRRKLLRTAKRHAERTVL